MENNLENKAKFFAQYWEQKVFKSSINQKAPHKNTFGKSIRHNDFLELKPLSSISDEDAIEVAQLITRFKWDLDFGTKVIKEENQVIVYYDAVKNGYKHKTSIYDDFFSRSYSGEPVHELSGVVYDYLRSKGYALPYMGLSVEEQVNRGWVKLKGETK